MNAALVLVCGPAGYGKTTIIRDWLQTSQETRSDQLAWLTLDRSDDDLTRLLTYLITALQHIRPGIGAVDHQPPLMHLVPVTRSDPALPLARLRAHGQLVEIRQEALCFLPNKVAQFVNRDMNLALTPEEVSWLVKKTEGWVSGLQLAATVADETAKITIGYPDNYPGSTAG